MSDLFTFPPQEGFVCAKCNALSQHIREPLLIHAVLANKPPYQNFSDTAPYVPGFNGRLRAEHAVTEQWTATICLGCKRSTVWRGEKMVFPAAPPIAAHSDMPAIARSLFEEAVAVMPASSRAAAALARASMEALLKHLFPDTRARNLQERVGEARQYVRPNVWKLLTTLRVAGNDALHSGSGETVAIDLSGGDDGLIQPLLGAINMLVEELITQPQEADALYDQIPQAKREQAELAAERFSPDETSPGPA